MTVFHYFSTFLILKKVLDILKRMAPNKNIKLKVPLLVVSSVIYPHFLEVLSIFYLQIVPIVPTKFRVIWPFISGEEVQKGFSRWRPWWSSCILDQNNFNYF